MTTSHFHNNKVCLKRFYLCLKELGPTTNQHQNSEGYFSRWHLSLWAITQMLLTQFWPNFKGSFLGSAFTATWHLSRQHLTCQHLSISAISQLVLQKFWRTFKNKFVGPSVNCEFKKLKYGSLSKLATHTHTQTHMPTHRQKPFQIF